MRTPLFALIALLAAPFAAHADTFSTFSFNNTTVSTGGVVTGNMVVDITTGVIRSTALQYTLNGVGTAYSFEPNSQRLFDNNTQTAFNADDAAGDDFALDIAATTLEGYTGGGFCNAASPCPGNYRSATYNSAGTLTGTFQTGTLSFVSSTVTPEPDTFALLGTGVLALAGLGRRRFRQA